MPEFDIDQKMVDAVPVQELLEYLRIEMKFLGKLLKCLDGGYVDMPDQYENVAQWAKEFHEEMPYVD